MPASSAALLVLIVLVPGYVWLSQTVRHRRANHSPTQVEEILTLVGSGLLISGPIMAIAALMADKTVVALLSTPADKVHSELLRRSIWLGLGALAVSIVVALLGAWGYRKLHPVRSGESGWHDAFTVSKSIHLDVGLTDGTTVRGLLYSYDGKSHGAGRDIVLKAPIHLVRHGEDPAEVPCARLVISETQIHSVAVHDVSTAPTAKEPQ